MRGVSASTLVALSRQQASNPRAPTWDFRRLLALGAAEVRDEVLEPRPSPVSCGGRQHQLALQHGDLVALDHEGVDLDGELVAAALGGPPVATCISLLDAWRSRRTPALRRGGLGQLLVLDTARRWADAGEDAERRDPWTARALGPGEVAVAAAHDLDERALVLWSSLALPVVEVVGWWRTGCTVREAQALRLEGLTADEAVRWREQGLDVAQTREGRRAGLRPHDAGAWYDAGWPLAVAGEAVADGQALDAANALAVEVGRRTGVPALLRAGVTVEAVRWWTARGHSVRELLIMAEDGMDLSDLSLFDR